MVGYDFDKTIYKRDCSTHFFMYMIYTRPYLLLFTPWFLIVTALYGMKIISKKKFKEFMYFFVPMYGKRIHKIVDRYWASNANDLFDWYCDQRDKNDIIVSAGLRFIIEPVAQILNVKLIATNYDIKTGRIIGENCYGEAKVTAFRKKYPKVKLSAYYSDSRSDEPMMRISKKGFLVNGNNIKEITGTY